MISAAPEQKRPCLPNKWGMKIKGLELHTPEMTFRRLFLARTLTFDVACFGTADELSEAFNTATPQIRLLVASAMSHAGTKITGTYRNATPRPSGLHGKAPYSRTSMVTLVTSAVTARCY